MISQGSAAPLAAMTAMAARRMLTFGTRKGMGLGSQSPCMRCLGPVALLLSVGAISGESAAVHDGDRRAAFDAELTGRRVRGWR